MKPLSATILSVALILISSCNKDEPKFSSSQIQDALFEMKGIYYGDMRVSYYHGGSISEGEECKVVSKDSLIINMNLTPMASVISDEDITSRLLETGEVEVRAGYDFLHMDDTTYGFVLHPTDVFVSGGYGAPEPIKIVFSQSFGGDAFYYECNNIMFNLSPIELWIGNQKYEPFQQLVYHYEGSTDTL